MFGEGHMVGEGLAVSPTELRFPKHFQRIKYGDCTFSKSWVQSLWVSIEGQSAVCDKKHISTVETPGPASSLLDSLTIAVHALVASRMVEHCVLKR